MTDPALEPNLHAALIEVARACRILEMAGHGDMTLGQLSLRDPSGRGFWMKRNRIGLGEVLGPQDFVLVDWDGKQIAGSGGRHSEWPIHSEIFRLRPDVQVVAKDLLSFQPEHPITEAGLRNNISVGIQYLGAWLAGNGCVPVFNLMEDAATAEISRSQIWQWIRSPKGVLDDGRKVTTELFQQLLAQELPKVKDYLGDAAYAAGKYEQAAKLFEKLTSDDKYVEFLTLPAYGLID